MAQNDFYNAGTNSTYNNAVNGTNVGGTMSGGGGMAGSGAAAAGSNTNTILPATSRTISFQINSSPQGGMIFIDGQSTQRTTPYTLQFTELELLTPKIVTVQNGNSNSVEAYIISSQKVTNTTTVSNGGSTTTTTGGYGGGYGGGGSGVGGGSGFDSQIISDTEPFTPERVNFGRPREAQR